jgi:hypothetical protein
MDLKSALDQARLILREEQTRPTLNYRYVSNEWPEELRYEYEMQKKGYTPATVGVIALSRMRQRRPREVYENPNQWEFTSTNYSLLMAIFSQVLPADREPFLTVLLNTYTRLSGSATVGLKHAFPTWNGFIGALPLLAEFCIRNNFLNLLLRMASKIEMPNASIALMTIQLEEMISLNFNVFTDAELKVMRAAMNAIRTTAERQTWKSRGFRSGRANETNPHYKPGFEAQGQEIVASIDAFLAQCEQARYWYLKGALEQSRNPEIESDKKAIEGYLTKLGFSNLMVGSLNAAEHLYKDTANAFELKSCLGHLRSFLEQLHIEACPRYVSPGEAAPVKWGPATAFLRERGVISPKEETFITTLYTLVSDEAIHPLIAGREYARLFRNIVIEYGLLFLTALR